MLFRGSFPSRCVKTNIFKTNKKKKQQQSSIWCSRLLLYYPITTCNQLPNVLNHFHFYKAHVFFFLSQIELPVWLFTGTNEGCLVGEKHHGTRCCSWLKGKAGWLETSNWLRGIVYCEVGGWILKRSHRTNSTLLNSGLRKKKEKRVPSTCALSLESSWNSPPNQEEILRKTQQCHIS